MAWTCYSCQTKNPNSSATCEKCGGNVAAPRKFYAHWVFGGGVFFLVTYLLGVLVGGILIELSVAPEDAEILAAARQMGMAIKASTALELKPEESKAAKAKLVTENKQNLSTPKRLLLGWFIVVVLFVGCGALVGFVSDGKTIWEAGIGSIIGQVLGCAILIHGLDAELSWMAVVIGILPGFGLAMLGAWLGENLQDRRERGAS